MENHSKSIVRATTALEGISFYQRGKGVDGRYKYAFYKKYRKER